MREGFSVRLGKTGARRQGVPCGVADAFVAAEVNMRIDPDQLIARAWQLVPRPLRATVRIDRVVVVGLHGKLIAPRVARGKSLAGAARRRIGRTDGRRFAVAAIIDAGVEPEAGETGFAEDDDLVGAEQMREALGRGKLQLVHRYAPVAADRSSPGSAGATLARLRQERTPSRSRLSSIHAR